MSVEELLRRHQPREPEPSADPDEADDRGSFGVLRGAKERAVMLELRKKDGSVLAIPYALIEQISFSPQRWNQDPGLRAGVRDYRKEFQRGSRGSKRSIEWPVPTPGSVDTRKSARK